LAAVIIQARDPQRVLLRSHDDSSRLILNHRVHFESPAGHFTVLLGSAEDHLVLHDPQHGPAIRLLTSDLLKLWEPGDGISEILGRVLVAIGKPEEGAVACPVCRAPIPESIPCPGCERLIPLRPAALLGCMKSDCRGRNWELLICPHCATAVADISGKTARIAPGLGPAAPAGDPRRLGEVASALDDLAAQLLAAQQNNPDPALQYYLVECQSAQKELKALRAAEEAERQTAPDRATADATKPAAKAEMPFEEPLDGHALGLELVKEFGLQPPEAPAPKVSELPSEFKPVKKEPPPKPEKKSPAQLEDYELFRQAVQNPAKPKGDEDFGTVKT
jgi:hypothetical protein